MLVLQYSPRQRTIGLARRPRGQGPEPRHIIIVGVIIAVAILGAALILRPSRSPAVTEASSAVTEASSAQPVETACLDMTAFAAAEGRWQEAASLVANSGRDDAAAAEGARTEATAMYEAANAVAADENAANHLEEAASNMSTIAAYVAMGNYGDASLLMDQVNGDLTAARSALDASTVPVC